MTAPITGDQVRAAVLAAGISFVNHHECGLCGVMVRYLIEGDRLYFDPSCDCCRGNGPELHSWDRAAERINMQSREECRVKIAAKFGLALEAATPR